jgi:hypothetical protein
MAEIRTQVVSGQRRIITKVVNGQRRVSCSCCEEEAECCMYPASAFNSGAITIDDLPDEISVYAQGNDIAVPVSGIFTKSGSVYTNGEYTVEIINNAWTLDTEVGVLMSNPCLFTEEMESTDCSGLNFDEGCGYFKDRFEDTYTVNVSGIEIPFSGTATRRSLCEWYFEGDPNIQESAVTVFYYDGVNLVPAIESPEIGWYAILGEPANVTRKTGFQNTPVGTYDYGGGVTVTVTQQ